MSKRLTVKILFLLFALIFMVGLAACQPDLYNVPEDYVEVESLRIAQANVALSPSGDTSSYQLEVEILPSNATNRQLSYYIPSSYLQYVTVSATGLVTAVQNTPENTVVPLKISSTSNAKATLTVNVVVEYIEVKEIYFDPSSISMLYRSNGMQVEPIFSPMHAQDGRAVTYSSFNENVATVNSSGFITPVGAGHTRVIAEGRTTGGKVITGYLEVEVTYAKGRYKLDVSDSAPQFNQIIGDFKAINFSLMILDEHSNPNINILWYVGSERVVEMNNQTQYQHIPNVNSRTTYTVSVRISATNEAEQILESQPITIFNPFKGFEFNYGNITSSRIGYQYGDIVTFALTEGSDAVVKYDWYLKSIAENGLGEYIASTTAAARDLYRRLNIEGDFLLTAVGRDNHGNTVTSREFEFGVTRYVAADMLLIDPILIDDGIPPESFNYYIYNCDKNGEKLTDLRYIGSSLYGETFSYGLNASGYYIIACQAIANGVVAAVDGREFTYESDLIRVYSGTAADEKHNLDILGEDSALDGYRITDRVNVNGVKIGGILDNGDYKAVVQWNNVKGICSYVAEIIKETGEIYLLDSDAVSYFGDNHLIIPAEIADLNEKFSVRIKQKGSLFTPKYYYGYPAAEGREEYYFDAIAADKFAYLTPFNGIDTFYITDMAKLGAILNYVSCYTPTGNDSFAYSVVTNDEVRYNAFTFNMYPAQGLYSELKYYPVEVEEGTVAAEYLSVYRALLGAQKAFCPSGYYAYNLQSNSDGSYEVTVMLPIGSTEVLTTEPIAVEKGTSYNYSKTPYGSGNEEFAIDIRREMRVSTSEQLYYAAEKGYRPVFASDEVLNLYNKALAIINSVIGKEMTDLEKALAFFDYLTLNVVYDKNLAALGEENGDLHRYAGFKLEGVFNYSQAVCDGISKAYVLLCAIEGIPCVRVTGLVNGAAHAWNKVLLDGQWYVVDATNGSFTEGNKLYSNRNFFAVSDARYNELTGNVTEFGINPDCRNTYEYYRETKVNECGLFISDANGLTNLLNSFTDSLLEPVYLDVKFDENFVSGNLEIAELIRSITFTSGVNRDKNVIFFEDNRAIICLR